MSAWSCLACGANNVDGTRFCGGCGAPRPATDLSLTGESTSAGPSPATPTPLPRPGSQEPSISGDRTYVETAAHRDPAASAALQAGLRVGRDARYELLTKLGEGGMGAVWKARDTQLGRDVAIKRILGHASPLLRERFQRETQAVTGLRHPNIVTVFDAGEDAFGLYLVMEFVPGQTLVALLQKGALPADKAVATLVGLCRGAAHAHKRGVVHRDIKPSNVMLDDDGTPRLLDFGLVRMDGASELSVTGVGMGTMDYAAPEQKRDASKADARSDVYSLGLVFYELLTGLRPPVTLKRAPEAWRALIEKATDSVAADRHANAEDLLADVEATQMQTASDIFASQLFGTEDDLRCPKCKLLNTLEAKFCRACSTSLRADCPACSKSVRVGLKRCDQCAAEVGVVTQLRAGLDRVRHEIATGQLAEASNRIEALLPLVDGERLGSADTLVAEMDAQRAAFTNACWTAAEDAANAEEALRREDIPGAIESWRKALATDQGMAVGDADWQQRLAKLQERIARAEGELISRFQGIDADVQAGRLTHAEDALAVAAGDLLPSQRAWQTKWSARAQKAAEAIVSRRQSANGLAATAAVALRKWEDEQAVQLLQQAAAIDEAYAAQAEDVAAASVSRIARRDAARSAWLAAAERLQQAVAHGDHRTAREAADLVNHEKEALGPAWFGDNRQQLAVAMETLLHLEQEAAARRWLLQIVAICVVVVLAGFAWVLVKHKNDVRNAEQRRIAAAVAEQERQRVEAEAAERARVAARERHRVEAEAAERARVAARERHRVEAEAAERAQVAADSAAIEAATLVVNQGNTLEFASVRALQVRMPTDPRVVLLVQRADGVANEWLGQCTANLGQRLRRGEAAALAEWHALSAWFGDDSRLGSLRADASAAAADDRLHRAGLATSFGASRDAVTGFPRKVVHTATGAELLLIPAGEFMMGSPESEPMRGSGEAQHRRQIRRLFYLGVTEVTQGQWSKVMGSNPSHFQRDDLPVEQVSWEDCQRFLQKAGGDLRLPSEAEWEYACRAGTTTPFAFGATITPEQVNYNGRFPYAGSREGSYRERTVTAGWLPANAWGLHDMHGNVWEWCQDGYGDYPRSGTEDPSRAAGARVVRGGSWFGNADACRSASRLGYPADHRNINVGFRLARTLPE